MVRRAACHENMVGTSKGFFGDGSKPNKRRKSTVFLAEVLVAKLDVAVERIEGDGINDIRVIVF